jgi:hypothetical protein
MTGRTGIVEGAASRLTAGLVGAGQTGASSSAGYHSMMVGL